jgi:PAS domain-containing protein
VNADTGVHPDLLNSRFGYVSISRASHEATLFTDDMTKLSPQLSAEPRTVSCLPTPRTRKNGPASRAIPISDHGFACRWLRPSKPWDFFQWATPSPNTFTQDHLRRTQLLAIPAAAAIQNSRLYERAEIFGSELQRRLTDLRQTEKALEQSEEGRRVSEDKFQKVFRSSPIPFSITTVNEGRFVDVNAAFERRYGYSRAEVIGRTVGELGIWEDPKIEP